MNTKSTFLIALTALLLMVAPLGLQAQPATEKTKSKVSIRVFNQAELQSLFRNVCSTNKIGAQTAEQALTSFAFVEEECSTPCCAHCTRCANTGEEDDCLYCDVNCANEN